MKRLFALLLAAMLALSCTLALAEEAATRWTITSDLEINRAAAKGIMANMGLEDSAIEIYDAIIAVLSASNDVLTIVEDGFQYDLKLNDSNVLTLAGQVDDEKLSIASTLFPNYVVTISAETIMDTVMNIASQITASEEALSSVDIDKLSAAVGGYCTDFSNAVVAAVVPGDPEQGEFAMNEGTTFNTKVPMNVDEAAIITALNTFLKQLSEDETVNEMLKTMGVEDGFSVDDISTDDLPEIDITIYMNIDENGNTGDATYVAVDVTPQGSETVATSVDVYTTSEGTQVGLTIPEANISGTYSHTTTDTGTFVSLNAYVQDVYTGLSLYFESQEDSSVVSTYIYYQDEENPLITEVSTIVSGGERTMEVLDGKRTELSLEKLISGEDNNSASNLLMDILFNGLGNLVTAATEAVPETSTLTEAVNNMM